MHRAIAGWLTERSWHAAIACAVCGALSLQVVPLVVVAAGIPVLAVFRFNLGVAFGLAAATSAAAIVGSGQTSLFVVIGITVMCFGPLLLAMLLQRTHSLNLTFQVAVLSAAAALIAIHGTLPDPTAVWTEPLRPLVHSMAEAGFKFVDGEDAAIALWARTMWGALAGLLLATVLSSLFLGRWWSTLLDEPGRFGAEYRSLRLGMVLGAAFTGVLLAMLLSQSALLGSLAWVGFMALSFQGLAAAHRSKAGGRISAGWLVAIYVLLIVVSSLTVFVLAVWGFADNWRRPRTQAV
jgi:hypothetical protein